MPHIEANGQRIHYWERGEGAPVVLGHGLLLDGSMFDEAAARLARRRRVIQFDFRGHGRSSKPREAFSLDDMARDLLGLVDGLGLDAFDYVGLSMGGMIGMRVALGIPGRVRSLCLLDTSADDEPGRAMLEAWAEDARGRPADEEDVERFASLAVSPAFAERNPRALGPFREILLGNDPEAIYHAAIAVLRRPSILDDIRAIAARTLVVVGEQDILTTPRRARAIAEAIPGARLVLVPGAGHLSVVEEPGLVLQAVEALLDEADGTAAR